MYRIVTTLLIAAGGAQGPSYASNSHDEISTVIQKYLDGTQLGDPELVDEAFAATLEVQWLGSEDEFLRRTGKEYISRIEAGKFVPRYGKIVAIDATEKSAMAKVEISWENRVYTDYMLLLRVEGQWMITNKIATWIELE